MQQVLVDAKGETDSITVLELVHDTVINREMTQKDNKKKLHQR